MAATKKRVVSFQTPKKRAMTPLRPGTLSKPAVAMPKAASTCAAVPAALSSDLENNLISAYREENEFLRNLKADALLYSKLLGITIDQDGKIINFSIKRNSSSGSKRLDFILEETEENYIFTLKQSENCNVPEYFYDVIEFDKKAFSQFFYKAMQAVYETRTNE